MVKRTCILFLSAEIQGRIFDCRFPWIAVTNENCCWCGSSGEVGGWEKGLNGTGSAAPPSEIKTLIRPDNIQLRLSHGY